MGEMADFALEQVYDNEEALLDYRTGIMSKEDAYERGIIDELGYEDYESLSPYKSIADKLTDLKNYYYNNKKNNV